MEWLNQIAQNSQTPLLAAFALGLLTAVSPCPLATNITATAYIAKNFDNRKKVLLSGFLYTLGRMFSYSALGIILYSGASKFKVAKIFQGYGEIFIGPVLIFIGLVMIGLIRINLFSGGRLTEKLSEKFKDKELLGSFILGVIFALAFCPYSGVLFFVILIPMTLASPAGLILPPLFSLGTGIPVIFFSFVIAFSIDKVGKYFISIQKSEKVIRILAGITFIVSGLYYLNITLHIFI